MKSQREVLEIKILNSLSIFVPAYNEEGNLKNLIEQILEELPNVVEDYEILIINDGSKDATGKIADEYARDNNFIRVVHHPFNIGFGGAQKSGYLQSRKEYVMLIPADGQFDIKEVKKFVSLLKENTIVVGYREGSVYNFKRKVISKTYNFIVRFFFNLQVKDMQWVKLVPRKLFDNIDINSRGAFVDTEILVKAKRLNYSFVEIPTRQYHRKGGVSKAEDISTILFTIIELMRLWCQIILLKGKGY